MNIDTKVLNLCTLLNVSHCQDFEDYAKLTTTLKNLEAEGINAKVEKSDDADITNLDPLMYSTSKVSALFPKLENSFKMLNDHGVILKKLDSKLYESFCSTRVKTRNYCFEITEYSIKTKQHAEEILNKVENLNSVLKYVDSGNINSAKEEVMKSILKFGVSIDLEKTKKLIETAKELQEEYSRLNTQYEELKSKMSSALWEILGVIFTVAATIVVSACVLFTSPVWIVTLLVVGGVLAIAGATFVILNSVIQKELQKNVDEIEFMIKNISDIKKFLIDISLSISENKVQEEWFQNFKDLTDLQKVIAIDNALKRAAVVKFNCEKLQTNSESLLRTLDQI